MLQIPNARLVKRTPEQLADLAERIKEFGRELGFARLGIVNVDPSEMENSEAESRLLEWLGKGFHGEMDYMARHGVRRARSAELVPGTLRVIVARMDYLPAGLDDSAGNADGQSWIDDSWSSIADPQRATISRYAHGRDYHKVMRSRLQKLAGMIEDEIGPFGYRVFTDSAPVMEVELARQAGLGWRGKHTLLLSRDAGSMFFLGELFVDVPLPVDNEVDKRAEKRADKQDDGWTVSRADKQANEPGTNHCGTCRRCIDVCPTQAIVAPYVLDARRCISYLTIELKGSIPVELRPLIGNRIYGCDDCQLVCPWNKYAQRATVKDFDSRGLDSITLVELFGWSEEEFLRHTEGSAIHRIGHERWLRNVAVGLGNALAADPPQSDRAAMRTALTARTSHVSPLVREHVEWALACSK